MPDFEMELIRLISDKDFNTEFEIELIRLIWEKIHVLYLIESGIEFELFRLIRHVHDFIFHEIIFQVEIIISWIYSHLLVFILKDELLLIDCCC